MPRVRAVVKPKIYTCDRCGEYGRQYRLLTGETVCTGCFGKASGQERGTEPYKPLYRGKGAKGTSCTQ